MTTITNLTKRILAYRELGDFYMDEAVDWAVEMPLLGYETPSLLILSGISKPSNSFETEGYLIASLEELNLKIPGREEAMLQYSNTFIEEIAQCKNVKTNLYQLYKVARSAFDTDVFQDFYLLYWAWDDLDSGQGYQHYWEGATVDNIEKITVDTAHKWLQI